MCHNVPKIRFKGYNEEWEQREFVNLLDKHDGIRRGPFGSSLKKDFFVAESDYVVYEQQNAIYDRYNTRYNISESKFNELKKFQLLSGDFIMSGAGTIGRISRVPRGIKQGVFNQALIRFRIDFKTIDSEFFLQMVRSDKIQHKFTEANPGSAMTNLVPMSEVKEWEMIIPKIKEQKAIGRFFKILDDTITLHQRKLEMLKRLKQAYLQQMFPENNEKVPRIRFANFSRRWEQRKLGDMAEIVRGASPRPIQNPQWFDNESDIGWLRISDVTEQNGRIYYLEQKLSKEGQRKTRVLTEPHLLLSIAATVGKPLINYVKTGVHDGFLIFLFPAFDKEFMFQWLEMFRPKWQKYGQPGSQINLNSDLVKEQPIKIPSRQEQEQIALFFTQIDNTIVLHQKKINNLKQIKTTYLKSMFI